MPEQACRDCGLPDDLGHRNWCVHAPDDPEPTDRLADAEDYAWADDRLVEQITGEPRETR